MRDDDASPSVTRMPGKGLPFGSRTVPRTLPKIVAWTDAAKSNSKALQMNHRRIESSPPLVRSDEPSNVARRRELGRSGVSDRRARRVPDVAARAAARLEMERRFDRRGAALVFDGRR